MEFFFTHKGAYMKFIAALTGLLLISIAPSTFALPSNDCAAKSEKVNLADREQFMKKCLAEVGAPEKVKEAKQKHKKARCEQNAKNMKLQGEDKGNYQAECVNKNEAVEVAKSLPNNNVDAGTKVASADGAKTEKSKAGSHQHAENKHAAKKHEEKKHKSHKKAENKPAAAAVTSEAK
jgi:hypothetical protein